MKRILIVLLLGLVVGTASFAIAAKVRTLTKSVIVSVKLDLTWNNELTEIVDVALTAQSAVLDDTGARAGSATERIDYNDLPAQLRTAVDNIVLHMGRSISNKAVAEDAAPVFAQKTNGELPGVATGRSRGRPPQ